MSENTHTVKVVFFDIGDTLGEVIITGPLKLNVFNGVAEVLNELHKKHLRLGVVSRIGDFAPVAIDQMLKAAGLFQFFETGLLHYISGDTPKDRIQFKKAIAKAGITDAHATLFIGENAQERAAARGAGMLAGAKPADALNMLHHTHLQ